MGRLFWPAMRSSHRGSLPNGEAANGRAECRTRRSPHTPSVRINTQYSRERFSIENTSPTVIRPLAYRKSPYGSGHTHFLITPAGSRKVTKRDAADTSGISLEGHH